jgi:DNA anti-recombination protein RmuC
MAEKDLGEELEKIEQGVENLKNKEFRLFGLKMTPMTVSALIAGIGSIIGALYAGFLMYQKIEEVAGLDVGAFEQRMEVIETKLDEAVDYTRDIKSGLRDDILGIEKQVDRMEDKLRDSEAETRAIIQSAEERFENKRDALQNDYDSKANRLSETNTSRMDELNNKVDRNIADMEQKIERSMKDLESRLNNKLQRALDNPLAN